MASIAVLGTGRIGKMHAEIITNQIDGLDVASVYDIYADGAQAVADSIGCDRAESVEEVMASDVDAVAICTSTDTHVDLVVAAAAAATAAAAAPTAAAAALARLVLLLGQVLLRHHVDDLVGNVKVLDRVATDVHLGNLPELIAVLRHNTSHVPARRGASEARTTTARGADDARRNADNIPATCISPATF